MIVLIALAALALPKHNNLPWELVAEDDDVHVKVFRRHVAGSNVFQYKVEAVIEAASPRVWEVITDVPRHTEYMPYVEVSKILETRAGERWVYQRVSPPLVSDRDYVVHVKFMEDRQLGVFEQSFVIDKTRVPAVDGVIRVPVADGRWVLEPIDKQRTRVVYELHTDPGGWLPKWVVNFAQKRSFPDLMENISNRAKDPSWTR